MEVGPAPALVLLDLMMRGMAGAEFIARKNQLASMARIPVCIMTASKHDSELSRLALAGPRDCFILRKPFDLDALMVIVERYC
jgi:CheY-like chemotaxis protein